MRLWLSVIAYNLGNHWRRLTLSQGDRQLVADQLAAAVGEDGLSSDQTRRCSWLLLAESHLTPRLLSGMLEKVATLPSPAR